MTRLAGGAVRCGWRRLSDHNERGVGLSPVARNTNSGLDTGAGGVTNGSHFFVVVASVVFYLRIFFYTQYP